MRQYSMPCLVEIIACRLFRHQIIISTNVFFFLIMGAFCALLALCVGNSPVTGEFPPQRSVTFNVFFDLRLNKRLSKQSRRRWFETPLLSLWRHCNEMSHKKMKVKMVLVWSPCDDTHQVVNGANQWNDLSWQAFGVIEPVVSHHIQA